MRKPPEEEYLSGNLTAMIDVVFQLIIFFVVTNNLQSTSTNDAIKLAMAPNGAPVVTKIPWEVNIDVDSKGHISIARNDLSVADLRRILRKAVWDYKDVPVVIRGDGASRHEAIREVMNACGDAGIYRIKFAALKERGR